MRERVPVRIQLWMPDGVRVDIRAWLDELDLKHDAPASVVFDENTTIFKTPRKNYSLTAHTDTEDRPWRFKRGIPDQKADMEPPESPKVAKTAQNA